MYYYFIFSIQYSNLYGRGKKNVFSSTLFVCSTVIVVLPRAVRTVNRSLRVLGHMKPFGSVHTVGSIYNTEHRHTLFCCRRRTLRVRSHARDILYSRKKSEEIFYTAPTQTGIG